MAKRPGTGAAPKAARQSNFELLRILAMLMVVASHWGWWSHAYPNALQDSTQYWFHFYFRTFGQVGVVLFVLISGYFMCKNQFKILSLIRLMAQIFCIILFLLGFHYLRTYIATGAFPTMTFTELTDWFIPVSKTRWWFVTCYVALFLLSPFLNKMIERLKKNEFRLLLGILLAFLSVFPSFFVYSKDNGLLHNLALFFLFYLIGAYIRLYQEDFQSKALCFGGAAVALALYVACRRFEFMEMRYALSVITLSVFLFLAFMHIRIQSKWINLCAATTFGVFLLHENTFVRFWLWNDVFAIQTYANTGWFIPVSILSVVLTFLGGAVIDYLRQITVEPLILKGCRTPKVSRWLAAIDGAMPKNGVTAEEGTKPSPAPGLVLLCAAALYFGCKVVQVYTQIEIAFKLFLVIAVVAAVVMVKTRKGGKKKDT